MGQIFVRAGLVAIDKSQKEKGVEPTKEIIQKLFLEGVSKIAGTPVEYQPWEIKVSLPVVQDPVNHDSQAKSSEAVAAADHTNPIRIAERGGFHVGTNVFEKANASTRKPNAYIIVSIGTKADLARISCYAAEDATRAQSTWQG